MKLDIFIRTHNKSNVHTDRERYHGIDKTHLIIGCLNSLVNSCNKTLGYDINFIVLDDHSTNDLFPRIEDVFSKTCFPYEVIHLDEAGYNYSALKQFEYCKNSTADLVYSIEDDYLHCESAMTEMLDSYLIFKENMKRQVCIYPFDMPDDYEARFIEPCYVVHGSKRHWRTGTWTTNTMLCSPQVFKDHWEIFEKLATEYDPMKHVVHEGNTICNIWRNFVPRFSPIPSLALHMQFDTQIDPYINWKEWWRLYSES